MTQTQHFSTPILQPELLDPPQLEPFRLIPRDRMIMVSAVAVPVVVLVIALIAYSLGAFPSSAAKQANLHPTYTGTVSANTGADLTLEGTKFKTVTVDASSADATVRSTSSLDAIEVGDSVTINGAFASGRVSYLASSIVDQGKPATPIKASPNTKVTSSVVGTVEGVSGTTLSVLRDNDTNVTVDTPADIKVTVVDALPISHIGVGSKIFVRTTLQKNKTLKATYITVSTTDLKAPSGSNQPG